jgi:hypothetical protein
VAASAGKERYQRQKYEEEKWRFEEEAHRRELEEHSREQERAHWGVRVLQALLERGFEAPHIE